MGEALLAIAIGCICSGFFIALAGQAKFGGGLAVIGIGFWVVSYGSTIAQANT